MDKKYRIRLKRLLWDYYAVDIRFRSFITDKRYYTVAKINNDGVVNNLKGLTRNSYEDAFTSLREEYNRIKHFMRGDEIIFYTNQNGVVNTTFIPDFDTLDELELKISVEGREKINAVKKK